jgi:hypothetical protein
MGQGIMYIIPRAATQRTPYFLPHRETTTVTHIGSSTCRQYLQRSSTSAHLRSVTTFFCTSVKLPAEENERDHQILDGFACEGGAGEPGAATRRP